MRRGRFEGVVEVEEEEKVKIGGYGDLFKQKSACLTDKRNMDVRLLAVTHRRELFLEFLIKFFIYSSPFLPYLRKNFLKNYTKILSKTLNCL